MAYKINGTTVVDNSRNVCACCVTSCCITASDRLDAPSGTTAQRPGSPATGSIYFDTDEGSLVSYNGTDWSKVGGAGLPEPEAPNTTANDTLMIGWAYGGSNACCRGVAYCCRNCDCNWARPVNPCAYWMAGCLTYGENICCLNCCICNLLNSVTIRTEDGSSPPS